MTTDEKDTTPAKPVHTMADRIAELRERKEGRSRASVPTRSPSSTSAAS